MFRLQVLLIAFVDAFAITFSYLVTLCTEDVSVYARFAFALLGILLDTQHTGTTYKIFPTRTSSWHKVFCWERTTV